MAASIVVGAGDVLLIVDVQNDFLPGGSLGVPRGDEVIAPLNRAIGLFMARARPVFASRDWHPARHCSFREQGGPWPPHCVDVRQPDLQRLLLPLLGPGPGGHELRVLLGQLDHADGARLRGLPRQAHVARLHLGRRRAQLREWRRRQRAGQQPRPARQRGVGLHQLPQHDRDGDGDPVRLHPAHQPDARGGDRGGLGLQRRHQGRQLHGGQQDLREHLVPRRARQLGQWGATLTCLACHSGTEGDPLGNGIPNGVAAQWTSDGHGSAAGGSLSSALNGCDYCHQLNANHTPTASTNPYRLRFSATDNTLCLQCHALNDNGISQSSDGTAL